MTERKGVSLDTVAKADSVKLGLDSRQALKLKIAQARDFWARKSAPFQAPFDSPVGPGGSSMSDPFRSIRELQAQGRDVDPWKYRDRDSVDAEINEIFCSEEWSEMLEFKALALASGQQFDPTGKTPLWNSGQFMLALPNLTYWALGSPTEKSSSNEQLQKAKQASTVMVKQGIIPELLGVLESENPEHSERFRIGLNLLLVILLLQTYEQSSIQILSAKVGAVPILKWAFETLLKFSASPIKKLLCLIRHLLLLSGGLVPEGTLTADVQSFSFKALSDPTRVTRQKGRGFEVPQVMKEMTRIGPSMFAVEAMDILDKNLYIPAHLSSPDFDKQARDIYRQLIPSLGDYMSFLLKLLVSSAPSQREDGRIIDLELEVRALGVWDREEDKSEEEETQGDDDPWTVEMSRHAEIIVKYVSSILLVLLKMFKRHQSIEYWSLRIQLLDRNAIVAILKFLHHDVVTSMARISDNSQFALFGNELWGQDATHIPALLKNLEFSKALSWRKFYLYTNLLMLLQKLTKHSLLHSKQLVQFKAHVSS
eukprot:TRINITY_DN5084_c0_g1_i5.p1 TRINITY_DN5084_c0_g1~~TRINITY_DN5084_c0_g1_i5.p1  ORF type:complete len:556 (-),score=138.89 TRINITY_DN5084_c0_g1_i5:1065-2681(-)